MTERERDQLEKLQDDVQLIREKIFNGHSESIARIETDMGKMEKTMGKLSTGLAEVGTTLKLFVTSHKPSAKKTGGRYLGSILIASAAGITFIGLLIVTVKLGIISPEDIGKLIGGIVG